MPKIIRFLGYNPLPEGRSLREQLVRHRTTLGLTQKEAAARLGVDPGTLARWARGDRPPTNLHWSRVKSFLNDVPLDSRRAG